MKQAYLKTIILLTIGLLCGFITSLSAQIYWQGGASEDWHDEDNWSSNTVPGPGDDVIIPSGAGTIYYEISEEVESVEIGEKSKLVITEGAELYVAGNFRFGLRVYGTLENHGFLFITDIVHFGLDLKRGGLVEHYGQMKVKAIDRYGIYSYGNFVTYKGSSIAIGIFNIG